MLGETNYIMWKWNDQHVMSMGQRKCLSPWQDSTYDLPNIGQVLCPLELQRTHGEQGHVLGSYLTRAMACTARISNVDVALYVERMKDGKFYVQWNKCENEMISMSQVWDKEKICESLTTAFEPMTTQTLGGHSSIYGLTLHEFSISSSG